MIKAITESSVAEHLPEAISNNRWYIFCPGCYENAKIEYPEAREYSLLLRALHCFNSAIHQFNGSAESPTLQPSLLVTHTTGPERTPYVCHSYVTDGKIAFLGDCTHSLANQTLELLGAQPYIDEIEAQKVVLKHL